MNGEARADLDGGWEVKIENLQEKANEDGGGAYDSHGIYINPKTLYKITMLSLSFRVLCLGYNGGPNPKHIRILHGMDLSCRNVACAFKF